MDMGIGMSRPSRPGLIVTLDALRTIYNFREPMATQYVKVANRCGLTEKIDEKELMEAFKESFKEMSAEYPNYGKGQLDNPRRWWKTLTNDAFRQVVKEGDIPDKLPDELYDHFSSNRAYELYPDVKPFLESMRELKDQYREPEGPGVFVGVVSNGDPRVKPVLQSLGLRVGIETMPSIPGIRDRASRLGNDPDNFLKSPWHYAYNPMNDFDMLVTSYEIGFEKPDPTPFLQAEALGKMNYASRMEQVREDWAPSKDLAKFKYRMARETAQFSQPTCIHIGDDFGKDYLGALNAGFEALHLARDEDDASVPEGTNVVTSLEEAAMAIRILAAKNFERET